MNYYERHIGDYLKDTAHLSLLEHGIYSRLLDVYYTRECALPDAQVARLIGARSKEEQAAMRAVLAEFFVQEETGDWVQMRCEREIERYNKRAEHNRRVGKLGGRPRKAGTQAEPTENPAGYLREPEPNPPSNQKPVTNTSPPTSEKKARKRADAPRPDDVAESVWADWVSLRQRHKADASATAIEGARDEAGKAGMNLEAFLRVWCLRGSRGLQADWLKPHERNSGAPQSFRERDQAAARAIGDAWMGSAAPRRHDPNIIDMEATGAARLGTG